MAAVVSLEGDAEGEKEGCDPAGGGGQDGRPSTGDGGPSTGCDVRKSNFREVAGVVVAGGSGWVLTCAVGIEGSQWGAATG
jgi:hypothetical protein